MSDKKEPSYRSPGQGQTEAKAPEQPKFYQGTKVVACRASRDGDPGYQRDTNNDQVTITLETGEEKVVKNSDMTDKA